MIRLTDSDLTSLMYDTNTLAECQPNDAALRRLCNAIQDLVAEKNKGEVAQEPVPWADIVAAIQAVTQEASRRGEMFPQEADAQSENRAASRRVCELIKWYATCGGSVAEKLEGWPNRYTTPQPDRTAALEAQVKVLRDLLVCINRVSEKLPPSIQREIGLALNATKGEA